MRHDNNARGVLLVSKKVEPAVVTLKGTGLVNARVVHSCRKQVHNYTLPITFKRAGPPQL